VLVISPLISLMKDQVDALERLGFRATVLNSTIPFDERRRRLQALRGGEIELRGDFVGACSGAAVNIDP